MKTKIFLMIIFALIISTAAKAQITTNPKLNFLEHPFSGNILVVNYENYIQSSDKTLDNFNKMQTSIANHETQIKKQQEINDNQQETIKNQKEEIADLKAENKEIKSDLSQLERTINDLKRKIDEIERTIKK
jgi:septal ring factor EnvC (AmiA/AmiB activator)